MKIVKPLFANKNHLSKKITLIEDDKILSNDLEVASTTDSLDIDLLFKAEQDQMSVEQVIL